MLSRDISVKMGNCHDTVYGIFWLPNKVSWSSSVCGLTDLCGNWQHRQGNSTAFYGNEATLWVFVCHLWKAFWQIQLTPSGLLQKCGGPLGNCIHAAQRAPQWPPPGQALAQTRPHKFAHRPPIFWFRLCWQMILQISWLLLLLLGPATINWAGRLPAAASALMAANMSSSSSSSSSSHPHSQLATNWCNGSLGGHLYIQLAELGFQISKFWADQEGPSNQSAFPMIQSFRLLGTPNLQQQKNTEFGNEFLVESQVNNKSHVFKSITSSIKKRCYGRGLK